MTPPTGRAVRGRHTRRFVPNGGLAVLLALLTLPTILPAHAVTSKDARLDAVAETLSLRVGDAALRARLRTEVPDADTLAAPADAVDSVLYRQDDTHALYLFERHAREAVGPMVGLAILIELPGADLPAFQMFSDGTLLAGEREAVAAVLPASALERLRDWPDVSLAVDGQQLLFVPTPTPGTPMRGSASLFDEVRLTATVQRALDIVNLMRPGQAPLSAVRPGWARPRIDGPSRPVIDAEALTRIREETHRKIREQIDTFSEQASERREANAAERAAAQARREAEREAASVEREARRQARQAEQAAQREAARAERAARSAALKAEMAERQRAIERALAADQAALDARLKEIEARLSSGASTEATAQ